jgi:hypothetical protein
MATRKKIITSISKEIARDSQYYNENWMNRYWRPLIGILYVMICFFDYILAPILFAVYSGYFHNNVIQVWVPLTSNGIVHLSFGAILGVTAYSRGKEKMNALDNQTYMAQVEQQAQLPPDTTPQSNVNITVDTSTPTQQKKAAIRRLNQDGN